MFDRNFTLLFAQFSGFRILVMANRFGCDNDLALRAHKVLIRHLDTIIQLLREEADAHVAFARNVDPAKADDLDEDLDLARLKVGGFIHDEPHPLLDHVAIDYEAHEWFDRSSGTWRHGIEPEKYDVSNRSLCGLREIIDRIGEETGLRFAAYLDEVSSAEVDEDVFYEVPPVREAPVDDIDGEDDGYEYHRD